MVTHCHLQPGIRLAIRESHSFYDTGQAVSSLKPTVYITKQHEGYCHVIYKDMHHLVLYIIIYGYILTKLSFTQYWKSKCF